MKKEETIGDTVRISKTGMKMRKEMNKYLNKANVRNKDSERNNEFAHMLLYFCSFLSLPISCFFQ